MKLSKQRTSLDVRKYSFSQRVVQEWNKLSRDVVDWTSSGKDTGVWALKASLNQPIIRQVQVAYKVISRFGLSRRRGSRAGKHKHCDRPKFTACLTDRGKVDDVIRGIPVVVGYRSTRYLEPGVEYQGRRDARTTTVKTVPRCSSRSVVRLGLFNARSAETEVARCTQV